MHVKIATVSGCIRTGERIPNTDRRFGAALEYVVAYLLQSGQDPQPLLFTVEQLRDAVDRAKTNPEDCPPFEPEQVRFERFRDTVTAELNAVIKAQTDRAIQAYAEELIKVKRRHFLFGLGWGVVLVGAALIFAELVSLL